MRCTKVHRWCIFLPARALAQVSSTMHAYRTIFVRRKVAFGQMHALQCTEPKLESEVTLGAWEPSFLPLPAAAAGRFAACLSDSAELESVLRL